MTSNCFLSRFLSGSPTAPPRPIRSENIPLQESLSIMGVDLEMARQKQPAVLRNVLTNEHGLAKFLSSKGASREVIASIISRFPRAITRSCDHLEERWNLWYNVFQDNAEIVKILDRSPESFFRSNNNENLRKNILFLTGLGITHRDLPKLLMKAPRVFSNSLNLNRAMVDLLQNVSMSLGGTDHEAFARAIIFRNVYILIRSTKRVSANLEFLLTALKLTNSEALNLLQGKGADILDLSHGGLKRNFENLREKLMSLGCSKSEIKSLMLNGSQLLFISPKTLNEKLDCLVQGGIDIKRILEKPKVLDYSTATLKQRLDDLNSLEYDFETHGIAILDKSKKRFEEKLERLQTLGP
ncbi:transcription termination factor 1, mitochondrial [Astyanax mexicanus]|uniref:Transcription termination factor 1, mitochondrial n=1 Tax=Astyanax mexicanus TaxID=7994 RepID=A0A8T2MJ21_ASTMX|nr:transcription termination factor 1, mitochondrial [Astyanax mexicanus]